MSFKEVFTLLIRTFLVRLYALLVHHDGHVLQTILTLHNTNKGGKEITLSAISQARQMYIGPEHDLLLHHRHLFSNILKTQCGLPALHLCKEHSAQII